MQNELIWLFPSCFKIPTLCLNISASDQKHVNLSKTTGMCCCVFWVKHRLEDWVWAKQLHSFLQGSVSATELLPGSSFTAVNITSCGTTNGRTPKKCSTWITLLMTEQHRLHMVTCDAAPCVCSSFITWAAALSDKCKLYLQLSPALLVLLLL